jgi:hypothetical protein|tara:strand:- start:20 stop:703 length:684 start_codon:yes stop_codon:yes gene_type:complete
MTINIITPNGSGDSLVYTCPRTAIAAEVTGSEVSSGEGKLEFKTTTSGTSAAKMTIAANGTVTLATPLPLASGGTGITTAATAVVQIVNVTDGALATGTTVIPQDDTIPQKTEGDEWMTLAITPKASSNKLFIQAVVNMSADSALDSCIALFQDTTANALAASARHNYAEPDIFTINHFMEAGTTSATTFKIRGGSNAGTTRFNGKSTNRLYGGVMSSSITITEYSA